MRTSGKKNLGGHEMTLKEVFAQVVEKPRSCPFIRIPDDLKDIRTLANETFSFQDWANKTGCVVKVGTTEFRPTVQTQFTLAL